MGVKAIAIHATRNRPPKNDAGGAFIPEAIHFSRLHGCKPVGFDNALLAPVRRRAVHAILAQHTGLGLIAFMCHGLRRSLQTGHDMATVGALADAIAAASGPRVAVALYACSTAAELAVERGGFADALRDCLTARGKAGTVDAHTTAAHATENPFVQRFDMGESITETVGDWLVAPGSPEWSKWRTRLDVTDLRFRFPLMTPDAIRAECA